MEEKSQVSISEIIKKYRKERDVTQEQLCKASGISISTLKKYESGARNPKPEQLQKIANALGVSVNVFMPLEVKDNSDIISTLIQLDREVGLNWEFKRDAKSHIIPETIAISFKDHELNKKLAEYIFLKKNAKTPKDKREIDRLFLYTTMQEEKKEK